MYLRIIKVIILNIRHNVIIMSIERTRQPQKANQKCTTTSVINVTIRKTMNKGTCKRLPPEIRDIIGITCNQIKNAYGH